VNQEFIGFDVDHAARIISRIRIEDGGRFIPHSECDSKNPLRLNIIEAAENQVVLGMLI